MAITFSKSISITKLLNAYNNNVVEFTSNAIPGGETITKANINIGGNDIVITPISDVFRYNFKEIFIILINNNFDDDVVMDADVKADTSLIKSFLVTYTLTFSDDTTEQTTETYVFVKSIEQIANVSNRLLTTQHILNRNQLTFFAGYPFDISHYSDGNVTLFGNNNNVTLTEVATNTYRLFLFNKRSQFKNRVIADGGTYEDNVCWLSGNDYELLKKGINILDIEGTTQEKMTINLRDICGGTYLKWFNRSSGWSYWLFDRVFKENTKTKILDSFNVDFESIENTFTTELNTGITSDKTRDLVYKGLNAPERLQLNDLFSSRRVEMYNGVQNGELSNWQTVSLKNGTFELNNTKRNISNIKLKIEINDYTQI